MFSSFVFSSPITFFVAENTSFLVDAVSPVEATQRTGGNLIFNILLAARRRLYKVSLTLLQVPSYLQVSSIVLSNERGNTAFGAVVVQ